LVKNPLHQIVRDNATLMLQLAGKLGLTPAARSGLTGDLDAQANSAAAKLDALISAARKAK
jgi:phage terminase small subunit